MGATTLRLPAARRRRPGRRFAVLAVAPALLVLVALSVVPLLAAVYLSFTNTALLSTSPTRFVGLANYAALLHSQLFWGGVGITLVFVVAIVTAQLGVGLALALMLNRLPRFQQGLVTLILIPSILSQSVASFQWLQLFDFNSGVLNYVLRLLHLPPQLWTASAGEALPSLLLVDFWEWTPFMVLLIFAGLKSLPASVFEAARVDGSTAWQTLRHHTVPLLRRVIAIAVILRLIAAFKMFGIIYILTGGGPGTATESLPFFTYVQSFQYFTLGYSSAIALVTLALVVVLVKIILSFMERPVGSRRSSIAAEEPAP